MANDNLNTELYISTFSDVPTILQPDFESLKAVTAVSLLSPSGSHRADFSDHSGKSFRPYFSKKDAKTNFF